MMDVIVSVEWAGQFVTLGAQLVIVMSDVEKTVDVVNKVVEESSTVLSNAPDVIGDLAVVAELLAVVSGAEAILGAVETVSDRETLPLVSRNPPLLLEAGLSAVESPGEPDMVIVIVTGTTVVTGTTIVLTAVDRAGQFVTAEAQLLTVCKRVLYTVDVAIEIAVDRVVDVIGPVAPALLVEDGRKVDVMRTVSVSVVSIVVVGSTELEFEERDAPSVVERELA